MNSNIFNKYKIIKTLNEDDTAALYLVREADTDKKFVLKKLSANTSSPAYNTVIQEFETVKKLKPGIDKKPDSPAIIDFFIEEEYSYLLLEYKDEKSLKTISAYPSIGKILNNRYIIARGVAGGGFGIVYLVRDLNLPGKYWALKEMQEEGSLPEILEKSFRVEAEMLSKLDHPSIPRISDFFVEENRMYLIMDYVQGETLKKKLKHLKHGYFTEEEILPLAISLCDVLSYLHNRSTPIVFRDLKPDNIMVTEDGHTKLIDFGIARVFQGPKSETTKYALLTEGYAPQEQWMGKAEPRSDIYSLGVTLYHLLTGKHPKKVAPGFPPVEKFNPSLSPGLCKIIMKAIEPKLDDRYETIDNMKEELLALFSRKEIEEKLKYHLERARDFERENDFFNANFEYMKALEYDKTNYQLIFSVARCCEKLGFSDKARENYSKILALDVDLNIKDSARKKLGEIPEQKEKKEEKEEKKEKEEDYDEETLLVAPGKDLPLRGPEIKITVMDNEDNLPVSDKDPLPEKKSNLSIKILMGCIITSILLILFLFVILLAIVFFVPSALPLVLKILKALS